MQLLYKPDWEETKERFKKWWTGEYFGRCAIAITAPKDGVPAEDPPPRPDTPIKRWTDLDYLSQLNDLNFRHTFYGGEAFPIWKGGYAGHTAIPAFLGCSTELDFNTGWWNPILHGEELEYRSLRLDKKGQWWSFAVSLLKRVAVESKGKSIPSIGAFGGCGDTLAALRGSDRLLYDVADRPAQVRAAEEYLMEMWFKVYNEFYAIIHDAAQGSTCWFPLWSPGKFYAVQNDFSYMISPQMFGEIFLPVIEKQTQFLDHCVYHVDGVGAFAHVPLLCKLPRLQALQILPGAGKPSPLHYLETLKYVQRAGKNLHISISCEEVELALSELSAKGLFIETSCETETEARELLEKVKKWSKVRRFP